jgi:hypothetical protein
MAIRNPKPETVVKETRRNRDVVAYWYTMHQDTGYPWMNDVWAEKSDHMSFSRPTTVGVGATANYAVRFLAHAGADEDVVGYLYDIDGPYVGHIEQLTQTDPREIEKYQTDEYEVWNVQPLTVVDRELLP